MDRLLANGDVPLLIDYRISRGVHGFGGPLITARFGSANHRADLDVGQVRDGVRDV